LTHDEHDELWKKFDESYDHADIESDDQHRCVDSEILKEWIQALKKDQSPEDISKMIDKFAFIDGHGKIDLDNFCIAAENGISILDKIIFEPKRLGKLVEGHQKNRIQKIQEV
jgi:hypothetical protein